MVPQRRVTQNDPQDGDFNDWHDFRHNQQNRMMGTPKTAPEPPGQEDSFWKIKTLEEMSDSEWERLCDGCGRCCLEKLEDEETGKIYFTHVGCRLLDADSGACRDYLNRSARVPDCVRLTSKNVREITWLPPSCAYRLVAEGRDLYWWHPLVSGDAASVQDAGVSVGGRVEASEEAVPFAELEDHIVRWPVLLPRRARQRRKQAEGRGKT